MRVRSGRFRSDTDVQKNRRRHRALSLLALDRHTTGLALIPEPSATLLLLLGLVLLTYEALAKPLASPAFGVRHEGACK